ncbi:hypothetical protein Av05_0049 [Escherichia phage Av-05]|uniref:Uncharacterized protein n=1 Tax=Escherichia phage Av-05 TaxID=1527519 RepID=A0A076G7X2_9CAUD|nr:hypothetical protein Av05_0049 [Escherichia phage Av-05]AII27592.1 hypothetical protein Av05_0049 [Escherichia phage Av-05]
MSKYNIYHIEDMVDGVITKSCWKVYYDGDAINQTVVSDDGEAMYSNPYPTGDIAKKAVQLHKRYHNLNGQRITWYDENLVLKQENYNPTKEFKKKERITSFCLLGFIFVVLGIVMWFG